MNLITKNKFFFLIFLYHCLFLTSCSKWWLGVWGVSAIGYMFVGGDPAYVVKFGKKINMNENSYNYEKQIHSDSTIAKVLKIVAEVANEFYLEPRIGHHNIEVSKGYYSFRQYLLSKNARKDYEYQFLVFSAFFSIRDSMFVVELSDFPTRKQSKFSKQIENAVIAKFETRLEKDAIHRLSIR